MPRKKMAHTLKVVYEPEPDGSGWNATIPSVQGCRTCGRSLAEARRYIRDALSLCDDVLPGASSIAKTVAFDEDIRWPADVSAAVKRLERARAKANAEAVKAVEASSAAARTITAKLSLRDAGELLGMSPEGVRKLLKAG